MYSLSRFNVPIFIMISGALNLNNKNNMNIRYIMKKRVKKVLIPLLMWTIIYCMFYSIFGNRNFVSELRGSILYPRSYASHLWYVYMCILLYLVTPVLISIVQAGDKVIDLVLVFWIVFSLVYPWLNFLFPNIEIRDYQNYNVAGGYVGYYILGYRLHYMNRISIRQCIYVIIFMVSWGVTMLCCCVMPDYINMFMKFNFPMTALMSSQVYLLIKNSTYVEKVVRIYGDRVLILSKLSFGIYFIHYIVADILKILVRREYIEYGLYFVLGPILTFGISTFATWLVSKSKTLSLLLLGI